MIKSLTLIWILLIVTTANGQKFTSLAPTPPMGWNSWNRFGCDINETVIRQAANAMVASGMKEAGYQYITIDDCWQIGRDSLGFIQADPKRFPSGMKALADYIHSKGLKFGIYSCAGRQTCANRPGSRGHEYQDALSYARFGVDYLKLDWCNTEGQNALESYTLMRDALYAAGRPVVFSICEWGVNKPWEWASEVGHLWRTTGDIQNNWNIPDAKEGKCWAGGVIINLDMQQGLEKYAGPDHWNDPDMLEVGNGGLTESESRSHFALWCMLAAPLMAGNDLSAMDKTTLELLTNKELIAIDQDPLGKQGFKIKDFGELEVYYKPLQNGEAAICLFNRYDQPVSVEIDWKDFTVKASMKGQELKMQAKIDRKDIQLQGQSNLVDLWKKQKAGNTSQVLKTELLSHDVAVFKLTRQ